ncbi:hypothetical protein PGT21_034107 [Puccinia graminis f. sp. tritici]|uniref:Uncharacterized protein n=1 Tax=Puccinia graminis f. sp. tritici TaxID=56615 RepID=A0A5B0QQU5_PUCGR|nr:hypothetical protein PGT21_034107 [Puccinia graminis f. sp. tritici]
MSATCDSYSPKSGTQALLTIIHLHSNPPSLKPRHHPAPSPSSSMTPSTTTSWNKNHNRLTKLYVKVLLLHPGSTRSTSSFGLINHSTALAPWSRNLKTAHPPWNEYPRISTRLGLKRIPDLGTLCSEPPLRTFQASNHRPAR